MDRFAAGACFRLRSLHGQQPAIQVAELARAGVQALIGINNALFLLVCGDFALNAVHFGLKCNQLTAVLLLTCSGWRGVNLVVDFHVALDGRIQGITRESGVFG